MPNFTKGKTFTSTEELTNAKLHQLVEDASMNVTAITSLTAMTDPVADADTLPIADDSATAIRKVAASNFLKKNSSSVFDAGTTRITGVATPSSSSDATTKAYVDSIAVVAGNLPAVTSSDNGSILRVTSGIWTTTASDAVGAAQIQSGSVTGAKLEDSGVVAATYGNATSIPQITVDSKGRITSVVSFGATPADGTVTTAKIADSSVTTAKIVDGSITSAKIAADAVLTAGIADAAVTTAKMAILSPSPSGTYGSSTLIPQITVNDRGQITAATTNAVSGVPVGGIIAWPFATAPSGFLHCDGSSLSRTTYSSLFGVIDVTYGSLNASSFNIPDYRGRFLRGFANGQSTDPDRASRTNRGDGTTGDAVGTKQGYEIQSHSHTLPSGACCDENYYNRWRANNGGEFPSTNATGGNETRPININVMWCIKF